MINFWTCSFTDNPCSTSRVSPDIKLLWSMACWAMLGIEEQLEKSRPVSLLLIRAMTTTARSFKTSLASFSWLTAYKNPIDYSVPFWIKRPCESFHHSVLEYWPEEFPSHEHPFEVGEVLYLDQNHHHSQQFEREFQTLTFVELHWSWKDAS